MMNKALTRRVLSECTAIGIDVSKASLETLGLGGSMPWKQKLANEKVQIEIFAQQLVEGGFKGKIICESTGHYHLLLGMILRQHGLDLRIINPLLSCKHQKARVRKTKTDQVDAYVLATMGETERELPGIADMDPRRVLIRLKQGQLHALDKQIQRTRQSIETYVATYGQLEFIIDTSQHLLQQALEKLKAAKRALTRELDQLLAEQTAAEDREKLQALPGFSSTVAGLVGAVFDRQAKSARSWVAYAGLDVSIRESGTWKGRGKLTKRGNNFLRKRLFYAAWGAVMNYSEVRDYYDKLKKDGRRHVEALCIIARKLLRISFSILTKGKTYDSKIAFG